MDADADVDAYIDRSDAWPDEMRALRPILLDCGLSEQIKWAKPCYSHDAANIAIMQEMKGFLALMFFKGALFDDPAGSLYEQGPNSRSARRMQFTSSSDVEAQTAAVRSCVAEAIRVEQVGLDVGPPPALELCDELQRRLDTDSALRSAFDALTPGRRREYNLYVSGAKQAKTRENRIDKYEPKILAGKGLRDR